MTATVNGETAPLPDMKVSVRQLFGSFEVTSMREIYEAIAYGYTRPALAPLLEQARAQAKPDTS